jgi:hypothetical protein
MPDNEPKIANPGGMYAPPMVGEDPYCSDGDGSDEGVEEATNADAHVDKIARTKGGEAIDDFDEAANDKK